MEPSETTDGYGCELSKVRPIFVVEYVESHEWLMVMNGD